MLVILQIDLWELAIFFLLLVFSEMISQTAQKLSPPATFHMLATYFNQNSTIVRSHNFTIPFLVSRFNIFSSCFHIKCFVLYVFFARLFFPWMICIWFSFLFVTSYPSTPISYWWHLVYSSFDFFNCLSRNSNFSICQISVSDDSIYFHLLGP